MFAFAFFFLRFGPEMISMLHALVDGPTDHAEGTQCVHTCVKANTQKLGVKVLVGDKEGHGVHQNALYACGKFSK